MTNIYYSHGYKHVLNLLQGIACQLDSTGYKALNEATGLVLGECKPYSITGSLPLVGDMQDAGFDIQVQLYCIIMQFIITRCQHQNS